MANLASAAVPDFSTVYVIGEVEPHELALFNASEIRVRPRDATGPRAEALGHGFGYWEAAVPVHRVYERVIAGELVLRLSLAVYTALGGTPFRLRVPNWVEARGVISYATVMGFRSSRFGHVEMWPAEDPRNKAFRAAVEVAGRLRRSVWHRLAVRDLHESFLEPTPDAFLFAFRAVEDVRQSVSPGIGRPSEWARMHARLGTSEGELTKLTEIAKLVRHGKVRDGKVLRAGRVPQRAALISVAQDVVLRALEDLMGKPLPRL